VNQVTKPDGFTIQELLVALNVGFLLVSFSAVLFLSTGKLLRSWQERTAVKAVVQSVTSRLSLDAESSVAIRVAGDSLLTMIGGYKTVTWSFQRGKVTRNRTIVGEDIAMKVTMVPTKVRLSTQLTGSKRRYDYEQQVVISPNPDAKAIFNRSGPSPGLEGRGGE